jgi:hypothetical protein
VADKEIVIDVVSKYTDHASQGLNQTGKDAEKVGKELDDLGKKKPRIHVDADDKAKPKLDKTRKESENLGKKRPKIHVDADDKAKPKLDRTRKESEKLGKERPKIQVDADDKATPKIKRITSSGLKFGRMSFTAAVKIKDFATTKLSDLKAKVFNVKNAVAGAFAAVGIGQTIKTSIDLEVQQQNLESSFEVLLGSKRKAQKRIDDLTTFAGSTPFTRDEIYKASRTLQVFTGNALSTGKGLKMVGDVAAGTNNEFSDVALWVGRMYDGMKNHQTIGEATAALQEMGAISGQDRTKLEALAASNKKISQTWPQAMKAFQKYDGLMEKQSDNLGNLMLGVKSFVTNNVFKKLGKGLGDGISPGLRKFRQWRSENKELIAQMGSGIEKFSAQISGKAVDAVSNLAEKANKVFQSDKFKNASISGKINIAWQEMIGDPFSQWWESSGKPAIVKKVSGIGKDIVKAGGNWFKESLKDLLPGGDKAGIEDYIAGGLAIKLGSNLFKGGKWLTDLVTGGTGSGSGNPLGESVGLMNVSASVVNVNGGIGNGSPTIPGTSGGGGNTTQTTNPTTQSGPTRAPGGLFGLGGSGVTLKNGETVAATGWKAFLGNVGVKLGSGATTAGGAATVGGASLLGGVLGLAGIGSAAGNIYNAVTSKDSATKKKEAYRGGTKLGMVGGGAATGAAIGAAFGGVGAVPGALIGAGVGGLGAIFKGNKFGDSLRKFVSGRKEALKNSNSMTAKNQEYWKYSKESISSVNPKEAKYKELASSVQKAYEENKKNTKQTNVGSKTTKVFSGATNAAGGKVSGLGSMSASTGGMLGTMGSMSLAAGGNLQSAGSSALSLAGALASAASTIASAASTTAAQASAIKSITSGSYLSNSGSSKSGKKKTSKKTSSAPKLQTALPKNGKFFHNAKGSLVRGHIVSELGEDGNEMVIPLSKHRSRALSLWNQAGQILGVTKHAKGGIVGGSAKTGATASSGSSQTVINVGGITISVNGSGSIVDDIKNAKGEIADTIMQAIADAVGSTASNRTAEVM